MLSRKRKSQTQERSDPYDVSYRTRDLYREGDRRQKRLRVQVRGDPVSPTVMVAVGRTEEGRGIS